MVCQILREGKDLGERTGMQAEVPEATKGGKDEGGEGDQWTSTSWVTGILEGM